MADDKTATLYRMILPEHTCPFGVRAKDRYKALLALRGYEHGLTEIAHRPRDLPDSALLADVEAQANRCVLRLLERPFAQLVHQALESELRWRRLVRMAVRGPE